MARARTPRRGETLADFLIAMQGEMETNALGTKLHELSDPTGRLNRGGRHTAIRSFQRNIRRWRTGDPAALDPDNAALLGAALNADFTAFVATPTPKQPSVTKRLTEVANGTSALSSRLAAAEGTIAELLESQTQILADLDDARIRLAQLEKQRVRTRTAGGRG